MASSCAGEKMALNIFEPRYRLMVRRCMEGGRRFGMACIDNRNVLHEDACEGEIVECQPQPDGSGSPFLASASALPDSTCRDYTKSLFIVKDCGVAFCQAS